MVVRGRGDVGLGRDGSYVLDDNDDNKDNDDGMVTPLPRSAGLSARPKQV